MAVLNLKPSHVNENDVEQDEVEEDEEEVAVETSASSPYLDSAKAAFEQHCEEGTLDR